MDPTSSMRMRLVFESIDFTIVGHMASLLESEGIPCEIRNAGASGLAGEIPHTLVYPELWVLDKLDEPRAREIIRAYRDKDAAAPKGPDWTCASCGETVDGVYAECWNCGADASNEPPASRTAATFPHLSVESTFAPVSSQDRYPLLDTLRGLALFGILLVNMQGFKVPLLAYHPAENYLPGPLNDILIEVLHLFVSGKFLPIFSFLFGLGLVLQQKRCTSAGRSFTSFLCGRMTLLLAIGFVHGIVLWAGDILALYGVLGFAALWLLRLGPRTILNLAVLVMAAMVVCSIMMPLHPSDIHETGWRAVADQWVDAYRLAGPFEVVHLNQQQWQQLWAFDWMYHIPYTLLFFMIGLAAGKADLLPRLEFVLANAARHLVWAIPVGIVLSLFYPLVIHGFAPWFNNAGWILPVSQTLGSIILAFAWLTGFAVFFHRGHLPALASVLAEAGRMSLSNYLFQSLAGNIIFMGWGFGFYGGVSVSQGIVLSVLIFTLQLIFSHWWMRRFKTGPVESAVRSIVYPAA